MATVQCVIRLGCKLYSNTVSRASTCCSEGSRVVEIAGVETKWCWHVSGADAESFLAALHAVQDSVTLSWAPPCDNGSAITFYKLEMDDGRGGDFQHVYGGQAELQSAVITGLQSGLHYRVRLRAENGVSLEHSLVMGGRLLHTDVQAVCAETSCLCQA